MNNVILKIFLFLIICFPVNSEIKVKPDYALVLAWNFFEEIKKNNSDLAQKFIKFKNYNEKP